MLELVVGSCWKVEGGSCFWLWLEVQRRKEEGGWCSHATAIYNAAPCVQGIAPDLTDGSPLSQFIPEERSLTLTLTLTHSLSLTHTLCRASRRTTRTAPPSRSSWAPPRRSAPTFAPNPETSTLNPQPCTPNIKH